MWIYKDCLDHVLGCSEKDMTGNTGWVYTSTTVPDALYDDHDTPLYAYIDEAFVERGASERQQEWPEAPAPTVDGRMDAAEVNIADVMEYTAEIDYRQCLSELGITETDLEGGEIL